MQGEGSAVCDGSYKQGQLGATFVVQHEHMTRANAREKRHFQSVTIPDHPIDQSSYRGELGGILAATIHERDMSKNKNGRDLYISM